MLKDLLPEDLSWYEALAVEGTDNHFHSEDEVSRNYSVNANVVLNCIKNGRPFCAEYQDEDGVHFYKDCVGRKLYEAGERGAGASGAEPGLSRTISRSGSTQNSSWRWGRILASMITYISIGVIAFGLMEG